MQGESGENNVRKVAVVGLGLIGGSFAKAFRAAGREVLGYDRDEDTLRAAEIEAIDAVLDDSTIPSCELIILAAYPEACMDWLDAKAQLVSDGAIVIDTAGIKRSVCERGFALAEGHAWTFCGAHPMAGTHHSGLAWARAELFQGAPIVLVPPEQEALERLDLLERMQKLLEPCGFGLWSCTTAEEHDRIIAYTSQLAHVVSNAYVKSPTAKLRKGFSAGSYADLTRVAQLNPEMWAELFTENADMLSSELTSLIEALAAYRDALDAGDVRRLRELLAEGDRLKREDLER